MSFEKNLPFLNEKQKVGVRVLLGTVPCKAIWPWFGLSHATRPSFWNTIPNTLSKWFPWKLWLLGIYDAGFRSCSWVVGIVWLRVRVLLYTTVLKSGKSLFCAFDFSKFQHSKYWTTLEHSKFLHQTRILWVCPTK